MDAGGFSAANLATTTWNNTTRSLTNLGAATVTVTATAQTTLAASASIDLRPAAGVFREITVSSNVGAGTTCATIQLWDGTNAHSVVVGAVPAHVGFYMTGNSSVGTRLLNTDGVNSVTWMALSVDWKI